VKNNPFKRLAALDEQAFKVLRQAELEAEGLVRRSKEFRERLFKEVEKEVALEVSARKEKKEQELKELEEIFALKLNALKERIEKADFEKILRSCLNRITERVCS